MSYRGVIAVAAAGGLVVSSLALAPALLAQPGVERVAPSIDFTQIGGFTPASGDPRIAEMVARAGFSKSGLSFTPASTGRNEQRAVTVAVRARSGRVGSGAGVRMIPLPTERETVAVAPIAYNLGAGVGWQRFASTGDLAALDLTAGSTRASERVGAGIVNPLRRITRPAATTDRPATGAARAVTESQSDTIDVGSSYSISRNIAVTAGLRYSKPDRERLPELNDTRRDSQAVYVGTAFRF